jgi:peptide deformylase
MILPIVAYGDPVLKKKCVDITKDYDGLEQLINDMYATMDKAHGVGLAAPQIGKAIRLFIVDASGFEDEHPEYKDFVQTFINPIIIEESGTEWPFNEGCLSIPGIREDVLRKPNIVVQYYDENWEFIEEEFEGIVARIIQHEYDHIEGKLFVEHLSSLKRTMLRGKLNDITAGNVDVEYRMKFPRKR